MATNSKTVAELPVANTISANDRIVIVTNTSVTNAGSFGNTYTIAASDFANTLPAKFISNTTPPANSSSTGTAGMVAYSNGYFYVCVATNTWQRAALSTF